MARANPREPRAATLRPARGSWALGDVYDALRSHGTDKKALSHDEAVVIILEGRGHHFDPDVVGAFIAAQDEFHAIHARFQDVDGQTRERPAGPKQPERMARASVSSNP
jgi:hypothetical protein